jgi:hypothetical protein
VILHEVLKDGPSERTLRCISPFEPFERSAAIERFERLEPAAVVEWLARGIAGSLEWAFQPQKVARLSL